MSATSATEEEQIGPRAGDSLSPLGKVATVKSGYAFKSKDWVDEGVPVVKIQNVRSGRVNLEGCAYVTEQVAAEAEKFRLVNGDVLITMSGEIGAIGVVRGDEHMLLNQRVGRFAIIDPERLDARFLFYLLSDPLLKSEMESIAYGAAQPNISPKLIEGLNVYLPGLRNQQRAAGILWSYDELIENNSRRIEILEEMAQAIYREWFVEFRYPGHEDVPLVDSELGPIPEGWKTSDLNLVAELSGARNVTKAAYSSEGYTTFSAAGPDGLLPNFEVEGNGIVISAVGARCGRTFRARGRWSSIANTIKVLPRENFAAGGWLSLAIGDPEIWPRRGSAQPFISIEDARRVKVLVPPLRTVLDFESVVEHFFSLIDLLHQSSAVLSETRDLLLPKLISGEIDVSELDIELADSSV